MVREGVDAYTLPGGAGAFTAQAAIRWYKGHTHSTIEVFREMLFQICMDYNCLPPINELTQSQIVLFYEGRRRSIKEATKPKKK